MTTQKTSWSVNDAAAHGGIRVMCDVGEIDYVVEVDVAAKTAVMYAVDASGNPRFDGKDLVKRTVSCAGWELYSQRTGELLAKVPE